MIVSNVTGSFRALQFGMKSIGVDVVIKKEIGDLQRGLIKQGMIRF